MRPFWIVWRVFPMGASLEHESWYLSEMWPKDDDYAFAATLARAMVFRSLEDAVAAALLSSGTPKRLVLT